MISHNSGNGPTPQRANRMKSTRRINDHSKGLKIAGGIDERALKRQGMEIAKVNATLQISLTAECASVDR